MNPRASRPLANDSSIARQNIRLIILKGVPGSVRIDISDPIVDEVLRVLQLKFKWPDDTLGESKSPDECSHELAHAAAIRLYGGDIAPHDPEWSALVEAAGFVPGSSLKTPRPKRPPVSPRPTSLPYEHRCQVCHELGGGEQSS